LKLIYWTGNFFDFVEQNVVHSFAIIKPQHCSLRWYYG